MEDLVSLDIFDGFYYGKRVLITGDTGFKGSWLSIWLQELGAIVYGYSLSPKKDIDNYVVCGVSKIIHHHDGDVRDYASLKFYIEKIKPELVFHLAAQAIVLESYDDPINTYNTNIIGTVNLIEACRNCDSVKTIIVVTSDKCYDNKEWVWGYRETDRLGGKDPYSASKACVELVCKSYRESLLVDTAKSIATVRAGNVIGAGDWADNRIVPDFFRAYKNNTQLSVRNPLSTRPWQHVLEPLSGYLLLAMRLRDNNKYAGAWNFGPLYSNSVQVGELIAYLAKYVPEIKFNPSKIFNRIPEANLLKLDISKARKELGWNPRLTIKRTIELTAEGYLSDIRHNQPMKNRIKCISDYLSNKGSEQHEN